MGLPSFGRAAAKSKTVARRSKRVAALKAAKAAPAKNVGARSSASKAKARTVARRAMFMKVRTAARPHNGISPNVGNKLGR